MRVASAVSYLPTSFNFFFLRSFRVASCLPHSPSFLSLEYWGPPQAHVAIHKPVHRLNLACRDHFQESEIKDRCRKMSVGTGLTSEGTAVMSALAKRCSLLAAAFDWRCNQIDCVARRGVKNLSEAQTLSRGETPSGRQLVSPPCVVPQSRCNSPMRYRCSMRGCRGRRLCLRGLYDAM